MLKYFRVAVGERAKDKWKVGDRAGIKWIWSICGQCEFCTNGRDEVHCINQEDTAVTKPGTFQQYAVADAKYATRIPENVPLEEAAPLMCGGYGYRMIHTAFCANHSAELPRTADSRGFCKKVYALVNGSSCLEVGVDWVT